MAQMFKNKRHIYRFSYNPNMILRLLAYNFKHIEQTVVSSYLFHNKLYTHTRTHACADTHTYIHGVYMGF